MFDLKTSLGEALDPQAGRELEEEALTNTFWREWRESKDFKDAVEDAKKGGTFESFQEAMQKNWDFWLRDRWDRHTSRGPGIR